MNIDDIRPTHKVQLLPPPAKTDQARTLVLTWLASLFTSPALLMVAMGTAHDLWPAVPPAGYWQSFLLLLGVNAFRKVEKRWWER